MSIIIILLIPNIIFPSLYTNIIFPAWYPLKLAYSGGVASVIYKDKA